MEQASEMSALSTKADMGLAAQKCPLSASSGHKADRNQSEKEEAPTGGRGFFGFLWGEQ